MLLRHWWRCGFCRCPSGSSSQPGCWRERHPRSTQSSSSQPDSFRVFPIWCAMFGDLIQFQQRCLKIEVGDGCVESVQLRFLDGACHCGVQTAKGLFGIAVAGLEQGPEPDDGGDCRFFTERRRARFLRLSSCCIGWCLFDSVNLSLHHARELAEQSRDRILSFADCLLHLLGGGLHLGDSNISGNTLYCVRDAFRQALISTFERG